MSTDDSAGFAKIPAACMIWLAVAAGCTGQVMGTGQTNGPGAGAGAGPATGTTTGAGLSMGSGGGAGGGTTTAPPLDCQTPQASPLYARLLSPSQYDHTIEDLFHITGDPAKEFGGGAFAQLDELGVERRANAAAAIASQAALTLATWSPCAPTASNVATCEAAIIDDLGAKAFRHPLSAAEKAPLAALFDAGIKEKDFATGVEWFLTGVLQDPDFLYQFARPTAAEQPGQIVALSPHELASRLAYFIWDSMPDDKLFAAASAGALGDAAGLRAELDRMLSDPRMQRGIAGFYTTWLKIDGFHEVARDDKAFTTDVVAALATSLLMSATQIYASPSPNVASLFAGQTYYMNDLLRGFYGLGGSAAGFSPTTIAGEDRRGIVTHPALMALLARPDASNPIARGLFVRRTLMCQEIPPPPAGIVIPQLPPIASGLSTRDRLTQHTTAALCMGCHGLIDPPGFALEGFDQVGRHRTVDSGKAVDTSGTLTQGGDMEGPFAKGDDLLSRMATSADIKRCFAQQYLQFALSRSVGPADRCSVDALGKAFAPSGDLKELVVSIARTDSFRLRLAEGGMP
jgi:Protein of unknown function (DUF1588)/Protein of unknown function (DUF1592)/Protein of unknown function (DUF1595)/Protein of unknown function (DUF1585)